VQRFHRPQPLGKPEPRLRSTAQAEAEAQASPRGKEAKTQDWGLSHRRHGVHYVAIWTPLGWCMSLYTNKHGNANKHASSRRKEKREWRMENGETRSDHRTRPSSTMACSRFTFNAHILLPTFRQNDMAMPAGQCPAQPGLF